MINNTHGFLEAFSIFYRRFSGNNCQNYIIRCFIADGQTRFKSGLREIVVVSTPTNTMVLPQITGIPDSLRPSGETRPRPCLRGTETR